MGSNAKKEKWIQEVISSTAGMYKAAPGKDLYKKVMDGLDHNKSNKLVAVTGRQWAAAAIILLAVNIGSVIYCTRQKTEHNTMDMRNGLAAQLQSGTTYKY